MAYKIDTVKCVGCGQCQMVCPNGAVTPKEGKFFITPEECMGCGVCATACPVSAIA